MTQGHMANQSTSVVRNERIFAEEPRSNTIHYGEPAVPLASILGMQESGPAFELSGYVGTALMAHWHMPPQDTGDRVHGRRALAEGVADIDQRRTSNAAVLPTWVGWVTAALFLCLMAWFGTVGGTPIRQDDRPTVTEIGPAPVVTMGAAFDGAAMVDGLPVR